MLYLFIRSTAMKPDATHSLTSARSGFRILAFLISAFCLAFASRGLFSGYSYWLDELISVIASADTWANLYSRWILPDVHPPLYQIALKLWVLIAGTSEIATRALSFLFAAITLMVFSLEAIRGRYLRRLIALLLVGVSPAFAFYSQETRSYSMALMLSSVVTISALHLVSRAQVDAENEKAPLRNRPGLVYYISSIALSLTHYFGWIYIFAISIVNLFTGLAEKSRAKTLGLIVAISIWPVWHILNGQLASKTGGNFWIKVSPIKGTITAYLQGCLPPLTFDNYTSYLLWALIIYMAVVSFGSWNAIKKFVLEPSSLDSPIARESSFLFFGVALMIGMVAIVDIKTPMSTDRNFIVALPSTMLLLANSICALRSSGKIASINLQRVASLFLVISICFVLLKQSNAGIIQRIAPRQNWKQLAAYVKESQICSSGCLAIETDVGLHSFYFNSDEAGPITNLSATSAALGKNRLPRELHWQLISGYKPQPVLGFQSSPAKLPRIANEVPDSVCLQPQQSWSNHTFVVIPRAMLSGRESELDMKPCDPQ